MREEPELTDPDRFPHVEVRSVQELHDWLAAHHGRREAVWLVTWKKAVPDAYVPHEQVLDELVAFGWIDGMRRRIDDERTMQLISPRRTRPWARSYRDRAERLIADGRMQPSGLADVERARASGDWDAMADVDDLVVPPDLAAALAAHPPAAERFAAFPPSTRRNVLRWIASARTAPTRERRIRRAAEDASRGGAGGQPRLTPGPAGPVRVLVLGAPPRLGHRRRGAGAGASSDSCTLEPSRSSSRRSVMAPQGNTGSTASRSARPRCVRVTRSRRSKALLLPLSRTSTRWTTTSCGSPTTSSPRRRGWTADEIDGLRPAR